MSQSDIPIGAPDIDRQQAEAFKRINGFTEADVEALDRYIRRETDEMGWVRPCQSSGIPA